MFADKKVYTVKKLQEIYDPQLRECKEVGFVLPEKAYYFVDGNAYAFKTEGLPEWAFKDPLFWLYDLSRSYVEALFYTHNRQEIFKGLKTYWHKFIYTHKNASNAYIFKRGEAVMSEEFYRDFEYHYDYLLKFFNKHGHLPNRPYWGYIHERSTIPNPYYESSTLKQDYEAWVKKQNRKTKKGLVMNVLRNWSTDGLSQRKLSQWFVDDANLNNTKPEVSLRTIKTLTTHDEEVRALFELRKKQPYQSVALDNLGKEKGFYMPPVEETEYSDLEHSEYTDDSEELSYYEAEHLGFNDFTDEHY